MSLSYLFIVFYPLMDGVSALACGDSGKTHMNGWCLNLALEGSSIERRGRFWRMAQLKKDWPSSPLE